MSFTVDLNDPLGDTLVGSSSSNTAAAASSHRRVLRDAMAVLPGRMERGQSRDGGVRLPPLVAPAAGADDQIVRRPAEAKLPDYKPPGEKAVYFSVLQI